MSEVFWLIRETDVGNDGTAFLRQPDHIQNGAALTLYMRCHGDNGADRHDTRTAYTRD